MMLFLLYYDFFSSRQRLKAEKAQYRIVKKYFIVQDNDNIDNISPSVA